MMSTNRPRVLVIDDEPQVRTVVRAILEMEDYDVVEVDDGRSALRRVEEWQPSVIITHSCGAMWANEQGERSIIVMDAAQTVALSQAAPRSQIVATHMETLDHATVMRTDLRVAAIQAGISNTRLLIPADGETLAFS